MSDGLVPGKESSVCNGTRADSKTRLDGKSGLGRPHPSILDEAWPYTPSHLTDIRVTFERARREIEEQKKREQESKPPAPPPGKPALRVAR